jgi:hypothetical protein
MALHEDKIRDRADRVLEILIETGRWLLAVAFIGATGLILARALASAP